MHKTARRELVGQSGAVVSAVASHQEACWFESSSQLRPSVFACSSCVYMVLRGYAEILPRYKNKQRHSHPKLVEGVIE